MNYKTGGEKNTGPLIFHVHAIYNSQYACNICTKFETRHKLLAHITIPIFSVNTCTLFHITYEVVDD